MPLVRLEVSDHIAVVRLDNPPVNAQPAAMWPEIADIFDDIDARADVRVAILAGAGRCFSAGADLKERPAPLDRPGRAAGRLRQAREATYAIMECSKPVIAAVHGHALGLGTILAASCDILVCSDDALFGLPEIEVGLIGGARHAMRLFPHSLLRRMVLTGYRVGGPEAYRRGIVEACVPGPELMPAAIEIARQVTPRSPLAVRTAKQTLALVESMTIRDGYTVEHARLVELQAGDEAAEALSAFREKRPARFGLPDAGETGPES